MPHTKRSRPFTLREGQQQRHIGQHELDALLAAGAVDKLSDKTYSLRTVIRHGRAFYLQAKPETKERANDKAQKLWRRLTLMVPLPKRKRRSSGSRRGVHIGVPAVRSVDIRSKRSAAVE